MLPAASFSRAKSPRWRCLGALAVASFAACATYESPSQLGGSGGDQGGSTDTGGKAPEGGSPSAGKPSTSGSAGVTSNGGKSEPQGGMPQASGSAGGGIGGTGGTGGVGGAPVSEGGEGGEPPATVDNCPTDPSKTAPGVCGCGLPDADTATLSGCASVKNALVHRYDFEGSGSAVMDRVGTAHGSIKGGVSLSKVGGKGVVVLTGGTSGPYVDLPNKLISALTSATLEAWLTWDGGDGWQRVFDFGDSTNATPEDNPANGKSYLFLTPATDPDSDGFVRAVYSLNGGAAANETRLLGTTALPQTLTHVALVVDPTNEQLVLYVDGASAGTQAFTGKLSSINDVNAWLGRSQYNVDPELAGTIHEFRVYSAALSAKQIATSFAGGPDPAFLAQ